MKKSYWIIILGFCVLSLCGVLFWKFQNNNNGKKNASTIAESKLAPGSIKQISDETAFSFAILGDTQKFNYDVPQGSFQKAVRSIARKKVDFTVAVGDLVGSCKGDQNCKQKLQKWNGIIQNRLKDEPVYPVMGNHDRSNKQADRLWQDFFKLPQNGPEGFSELTYSFDYGNSHFVILNSESPQAHKINSVQREWLKKDLTSNNKTNTFVFFHEPAFPVSSKINESLDLSPSDRDELWRILDEHNVTAVFTGHEHIFSRRKINSSNIPGLKNDIYQFVVGNTDTFLHDLPKPGIAESAYRGKHFVIVSVDNDTITIRLFTPNGKMINSFSFSK